MDFGPMHPDVWADTYADRWNYYIQFREAFEDAFQEETDRLKRRKGNDSNVKQGMKKLLAAHGG